VEGGGTEARGAGDGTAANGGAPRVSELGSVALCGGPHRGSACAPRRQVGTARAEEGPDWAGRPRKGVRAARHRALLGTLACCAWEKKGEGRRKKEGGGGEKKEKEKKEKKKEKKRRERKRERDAAEVEATTAGPVEHARWSSDTQRLRRETTRAERERAQRLDG